MDRYERILTLLYESMSPDSIHYTANRIVDKAEKHIHELDNNDYEGFLDELIGVQEVAIIVKEIGIPTNELFSQHSDKAKYFEEQLQFGEDVCDLVQANRDILSMSFAGSNGILPMVSQKVPGTKLVLDIKTFFINSSSSKTDRIIRFIISSPSKKEEIFYKDLEKAGFDDGGRHWYKSVFVDYKVFTFMPSIDDKADIDYALNLFRKMLRK